MKPWGTVLSVVAGVMCTTGCGRGLIVRYIGQHDQIVRTYELRDGEGATIVISKWGTTVRKWRVTDDTAGVPYQVDPIARICRSGVDVVPCENVKRDADMGEYIDW